MSRFRRVTWFYDKDIFHGLKKKQWAKLHESLGRERRRSIRERRKLRRQWTDRGSRGTVQRWSGAAG